MELVRSTYLRLGILTQGDGRRSSAYYIVAMKALSGTATGCLHSIFRTRNESRLIYRNDRFAFNILEQRHLAALVQTA